MNGQAAESGGRELEGAEVQINVEAAALAGGHWAAPAGAVPPLPPAWVGERDWPCAGKGHVAARGSPRVGTGGGKKESGSEARRRGRGRGRADAWPWKGFPGTHVTLSF